jgi:hypothetical protein
MHSCDDLCVLKVMHVNVSRNCISALNQLSAWHVFWIITLYHTQIHIS